MIRRFGEPEKRGRRTGRQKKGERKRIEKYKFLITTLEKSSVHLPLLMPSTFLETEKSSRNGIALLNF